MAHRTDRPDVHPWIRLAAYLVPLCILPSALYRIQPVIAVVTNPACSNGTAWEPYYIVSLSVVNLAVGLLTIGLVERWGEVFPRWIPVVGGRAIRPLPVTVIALTGAGSITAFMGYYLLNKAFGWVVPPTVADCPHPFEGAGGTIALASYVPLLLWPPLLITVTISYYRRRVTQHRSPTRV